MTNRERVEALLRREKPDRIPIWANARGFLNVYAGGTIADTYANPEFSLNAQRKGFQDLGWVDFPTLSNPTGLAREFGGEIKMPDSGFSQAPMITRFAVETEEDVWNLKMPDIRIESSLPTNTAIAFCRLASQEKNDNGVFNVMMWQAVFTAAGNIAGLEKMARWMIRKPDTVHHLLRMVVDFNIELAQYYKKSFGVETVLPYIGEPSPSNQIISPGHFKQFVLPYLTELCEALLTMGYKHIFAHICGEQNLNLPYWAQIPFGDPGIISVGQEIGITKMADHFPKDIIMGNLDPIIIQTGTPEEVYEATRKVVEEGKHISNGYVFAPGCELPPMAPIENVKEMTKAVNDLGRYE